MERLIGRSAPIQRASADIQSAGQSDASVLVTGERGVGKRLVARLIHGRGRRRLAPLTFVDCLGVSDTEIAARLFGQVLGDPNARLSSAFEGANTGTLVLTDAAELSPALQVTLLGFLGIHEFPDPGSPVHVVDVGARLISTSHQDLFEDVAAGRFLDRLFYRLNVVHIPLPPLRKRRADIPLLLHHFLRLLSATQTLTTPRLTDRARTALYEYDWPGNVTQLKAVVGQLVAESGGATIDWHDLPRELLMASVEHGALRES